MFVVEIEKVISEQERRFEFLGVNAYFEKEVTILD